MRSGDFEFGSARDDDVLLNGTGGARRPRVSYNDAGMGGFAVRK